MTDLDLILKRRNEVLQILAEAHKALAEAERELAELDVAGKTLARLTGGEWPTAGEEDPIQTALVATAPKLSSAWHRRVKAARNVTDMIFVVLEEAYQQGIPGLAPKDVRAAIKEKFDFDVRSEYMSTTMWRLADRGKLERAGDGLYAVPGGQEVAGLDEETRKLV
nr:hypothetical protein [uncultured Devosia sp.]